MTDTRLLFRLFILPFLFLLSIIPHLSFLIFRSCTILVGLPPSIHLSNPMILVILLLLSFLLGTWLLTRQGETRPTRPAVFHADLRSGTYREIDPVTQLEINPRHKPDSREALDDFFGSRPTDARPNRRHCREISPGFRSQRDFAEVELVTCVACTERWLKSYTYSAPCRHRYCPECLTVLFDNATKDESMYPPRCCEQVIPLASVRSIISTELADTFADKAEEYETLDRTYCVNPSCGRFIPPSVMSHNHAGCHKCGTSTCARCKKKYHAGHCLPDHNMDKLLKLAKEKKWQSCSNCRRLVEKRSGCDHMR